MEFDDSKTIRELIEYAFNVFGYYEPAGVELVTIFQCHHSQSNVGWFTTDTGYGIAEEFQGKGYAAESIDAAVNWAPGQPDVKCVEADT